MGQASHKAEGPEGQGWLFDPAEPSAPSRRFSAYGLVVREVRCRSLLNVCDIGDYSFNCYVGCSHACGYCYARYMQRFHPHEERWGTFVDVKVNAPQALTRQLRRLEPGSVFTCSACDGWQPIERDYRLTRECCRRLLDAGFRLMVLTKSDLMLRDLDVFEGRRVCVGVTITTPDEAWARIWEPGASSVAARLEILRQARSAGLETAIMFGPLLPGISDTDEALARLFRLAREARVSRLWTDGLNLRLGVWPAVEQVLSRHRPELLERYRRILFEPAARREYRRHLKQRIAHARRSMWR